MQIILPKETIFSPYSYKEIPRILKQYGSRVLLATGENVFLNSSWGRDILKLLKKNKIKFFLYNKIKPEPDCCAVERGIGFARRNRCDVVIGIGGGSVIDVSKAAAGLFNENFNSVSEYLYGKKINSFGIPFVAVATTSGSGSEVTKNAVLKDNAKCIKTSIRDFKLLPKVALVDPVLTLSLPKQITLHTALDALTHAVESYVSLGSNSLTEALALKSIDIIYNNLPLSLSKLKNLKLREHLSEASLMAGISFSNAGLGLAHAISHPIGALFGLSHGLVNAVLLPVVSEFNYQFSESKFNHISKCIL
ncbi:MAG: iron-containing alcohol dehydrogenase, partial [Candidatus Saelkia tenebricola]|nr:iron-containing alcohol dehydrogenase [Candidatus Saelkia tenebricola]